MNENNEATGKAEDKNINHDIDKRYRRLFIAIPLSESTKMDLKKNLQDLPGKKVPEHKWHFTIEFLGNVEEERLEDLYTLFKEIALPPAFEVVMNCWGAFPHPNAARIIWAGLDKENKELAQLSHLFKDALSKANFFIDTRPFIPHLTVSRFFRPENVEPWLTQRSFPHVKAIVNKVVLIQSILLHEHSRYIELLSRTLG